MAEWLHLHFPAIQLDLTYGTDQAAILVNAQRRVLALTPAAQANGISCGMSASAASLLSQSLAIQVYDASLQQQWLARIAMLCYRLGGQVLVHEQDISLRIDDLRLLYQGNIKPLWQTLMRHLQAYRLRVQAIRVATPQQGLLLAPRQPINRAPRLSSQQAAQCLQALPLSDCGLATETLTKLSHSGLATLGQLQALPTSAITRRFGKALTQWLADLTTSRPNEQAYFQPPAHFSETTELSREAESTGAIRFPLRPMIDNLEHWLESQKLAASALRIRLFDRQKTCIGEQTVQASTPLVNSQDWLRLVDICLAQWQIKAPILQVSLTAQGICLQAPDSDDLFAAKPGMQPSQVLDLLRTKLGNEAVQYLSGEPDARPEYVCQTTTQAPKAVVSQVLGALWLVPACPTTVSPWRPIYYHQRIHSGWWEAHACRRDYYFASHADGRCGWLFRDASGAWFLQGYAG